MIALFTDFGGSDLYVGQVKAVLHQHARGIPVIDLMHDAPGFNIRAGAHLLAALSAKLPHGTVFFAVVDPGVGSARAPAVLLASGRWFVGPDNGLLSVLAARAQNPLFWRISWQPDPISASFHGRDLFAPICALIAAGQFPNEKLIEIRALDVQLGAGSLEEIIYCDHYGNAMTGIPAHTLDPRTKLKLAGRMLERARFFTEAQADAPFWYENSLGLAEIAVNQASAARSLGLKIGDPVVVVAP